MTPDRGHLTERRWRARYQSPDGLMGQQRFVAAWTRRGARRLALTVAPEGYNLVGLERDRG